MEILRKELKKKMKDLSKIQLFVSENNKTDFWGITTNEDVAKVEGVEDQTGIMTES